jgi:hypothetical protein
MSEIRDWVGLISKTLLVITISTIHPWLAAGIPKRARERLQRNHIVVALFAFAFAYSMTTNFQQSIIITVLFFFLRQAIRIYYA